MNTDPTAQPAETAAAAPATDSPATTPAQSAETPSTAPAPARDFKIGSQRPGSGKIKARPHHTTKVPVLEKATHTTVVPNRREGFSPELELEVAEALGEMSLDEALAGTEAIATGELQPDSRHMARVVSTHRDDVFVDLGGGNQGFLSRRQLAKEPVPGMPIEVTVQRYSAEDGLYFVGLPGGAVDVGDWSTVAEGMVVEARITGHNKGGLECDVSQLRGFIPASQISTYRVNDFAPLVGEKMTCLITEANPEKRNLVLSRRAIMEREQAESKERLLGELAEGQVREGTVRSLQDFGAFVDLGGIDGLLHVSQLSWQRIKHPSELLSVGQRVKVLVRKIDQETGKIGLAMRDLVDNPWNTIAHRCPVTTIVQGKVTKVMDFGEFVEIEPGIEGLVHISELAHSRVFRVRDVVKEGDLIEAKVLAIDPEQQRISLSMKALAARPEPIKAAAEPETEEAPPPPIVSKRTEPLKGGKEVTGQASAGEKFGLKW